MEKTIAADFVAELRRLLRQGTPTHKFALVRIPQHHAKGVVNENDAWRIRVRAKCHFIVFGTAKDREIAGSTKHILNLDVQVAHWPIPRTVSQKLSQEMAEVFPRRLHIDTRNDLLSLEFTSEWVDCVARYIIGIAASLSGDLAYAESLFLDLFKNKHLQRSALPPLRKMRQRIPIRLGEIYAFRASQVYEQWCRERNPMLIEEMWHHLVHLRNFYPEHYSGRLLSAIYFFIARRDVEAALREIRKCRTIRDATWRYSYAFLVAYCGKMLRARRMYQSAFEHHCNSADVPLQTEEFMIWLLQEEPDKVQLHFCLGLVNWHAKDDKKQAVQDFRKFLASNGSQEFPDEVRLAHAYVSTLEGELNKEKTEQQDRQVSSGSAPGASSEEPSS
ncbi:hypothetical protein HY605_05835 [Candidatus Peregrinibacteria bacterium]|nr:hypothetical protein [Candidatus Peregrinibacteria bacterium]